MGKNAHVDLFKDMIPAIDLAIKELWDASTDDGRKDIIGDLWNLNRYISNVKTKNKDVQEHYVLAVNEYYNKNWSVIQKHPKLLWLLLCICSYDKKTTYYHEWIGNKKKVNTDDKKIKFLAEIYKSKKLDEIELLVTIMSNKDIKELAMDNGLSDTEINKILK